MDSLFEMPLEVLAQNRNEWWTPTRYIEAARDVLGEIDLDPASCEEANRTVKARHFYTAHENGLTRPWEGRIFLNPPYSSLLGVSGREGSRQGLVKPFVFRLCREYQCGGISQAILLVTSDTDASWFKPLWDYPICFADHKVMFHRPGRSNEGQFFGTTFIYLGPARERFTEIFRQFGPVVCSVRMPDKKRDAQLSLWEG